MAKVSKETKTALADAPVTEDGPVRPVPSIPVRATKRGYYDRIREPGDEFLIRPPYPEERERVVDGEVEVVTVTINEFSKKWMERADAPSRTVNAATASTPADAAKSPTGDADPLGAA